MIVVVRSLFLAIWRLFWLQQSLSSWRQSLESQDSLRQTYSNASCSDVLMPNRTDTILLSDWTESMSIYMHIHICINIYTRNQVRKYKCTYIRYVHLYSAHNYSHCNDIDHIYLYHESVKPLPALKSTTAFGGSGRCCTLAHQLRKRKLLWRLLNWKVKRAKASTSRREKNPSQ